MGGGGAWVACPEACLEACPAAAAPRPAAPTLRRKGTRPQTLALSPSNSRPLALTPSRPHLALSLAGRLTRLLFPFCRDRSSRSLVSFTCVLGRLSSLVDEG